MLITTEYFFQGEQGKLGTGRGEFGDCYSSWPAAQDTYEGTLFRRALDAPDWRLQFGPGGCHNGPNLRACWHGHSSMADYDGHKL